MKKPVYKVLDEKGRVLIPLEMRQKAEMEKGDILKVSINTGKIVISKSERKEGGNEHEKQSIQVCLSSHTSGYGRLSFSWYGLWHTA